MYAAWPGALLMHACSNNTLMEEFSPTRCVEVGKADAWMLHGMSSTEPKNSELDGSELEPQELEPREIITTELDRTATGGTRSWSRKIKIE